MRLDIRKSPSVAALLLGVMIVSDAVAAVYKMPDASDDLLGEVQTIASSYEDTFIDIGRIYNVGYEELKSANPAVDPWLPGVGTNIVLPTQFVLPEGERRGIVVNVAEYRIYYFYTSGGVNYVKTAPASVGRMDWSTPVGRTNIVAKVRNPSWYPPESIRDEHAARGDMLPKVVPPGPDNPLGAYALRLGFSSYLIHGTNRPEGLGMRVTHGCVRLLPEDIAWLFPQVDLKTPVSIINQPVKFGWSGDELYLEVHPSLEKSEKNPASADMTLITREYVKVTGTKQADVDWERVAQVYRAQSGVPVKVGVRIPVEAGSGTLSRNGAPL
jgi:L,D-transpeptidase ErfK/SrfK